MKDFFVSFLVFLLLTPSIACAMPVCLHETEEKGIVATPCSEHHEGTQSKKDNVGGVRFMLDCMGVDLQKADTVSIENANVQLDPVHYLFINDAVLAQNIYEGRAFIREPPPDGSYHRTPHTSIILSTQRLRI